MLYSKNGIVVTCDGDGVVLQKKKRPIPKEKHTKCEHVWSEVAPNLGFSFIFSGNQRGT